MTDKFQALRDAANRCTRVNAEVALMCEAALAAVAEVEALRKKAARYDWLRDQAHPGGEVNEELYVAVDSPTWPNHWALTGQDLDAAIDAALRAKESNDDK